MKSNIRNLTLPEEQVPTLLVLFATLFGLLLRLALPLTSSFPLNDGGLFYAMIRDLQANSYALPVFASYNSAHIPFAYPPLGFYVAGLLNDLTRIPLLDLLRLLPAIVSAATIPVFYLLAKEFLPSKTTAALAAFLFAFTPRAYEWHIMGGGITRSFGFLFALLAIYSARRLYLTHSTPFIFWTSVWASLTVLTHPEAIPHTILAPVIIYLFTDRSRKGFLLSFAVAGLVILFSAPWWFTVVSRHGIDPLLAAAATAGVNNTGWLLRLFSSFRFDFTSEPYLRLVAIFALIGVFHQFGRHKFFLPTWMLLHYLSEPRSGTLYMMIPLVLLAASGLELILSAIANGASRGGEALGFTSLLKERGAGIFFVFLTAYLLLAGYVTPFKIFDRATLKPAQLEAMAWIRENTPPDATFLVITGEQPLLDPASDWFPALTGRRSLGTVFGYEWVNDGRFAERVARYGALQECANQTATCLERWSEETGMEFAYVYIQSDPTASSLLTNTIYSEYFRLKYQNGGVYIFERIET